MDYLVTVIVYAVMEDEALNEAYNLAEGLVDWHDFSSFKVTAESSSWPNCWKPYRLESETGQKLVQESMNGYHEAFLETMKTVRGMLDQYSDEQIFNNEFVQEDGKHLTKYEFSKVSGFHNNECRLFGSDGDNITTQRELDHLIKDFKDLWVVQIDCHN